jgi:hypothetical protein
MCHVPRVVLELPVGYGFLCIELLVTHVSYLHADLRLTYLILK